MAENPAPPAAPAPRAAPAAYTRTKLVDSLTSILRRASDVTGPPPVPGTPVRQYKRTTETISWFTEQAGVLHVLRVLSTTDGSLLLSVDLTAPNQNGATGEFSKQVDIPKAAVDPDDVWFEVGAKIVPGMDREHHAHRFRVHLNT